MASTKFSDCDYNVEKKANLLPPMASATKKTRTKFLIRTGSTYPQNIGLHVNTNLLVKSRRKLDHRNCLSALLFCLLLCHVIFTHMQSQTLRDELEVTKRQVNLLIDNLESTSAFYETLQKKMKEIENGLKPLVDKSKVLEHSVAKREVEGESTCYNCTDVTRQARSVGRGKHSLCKNRNGSRRRCYRTSGPFAVHLRGALPEITVRDGGIVAPWYIDKTSSGMFLLADGVMGEGRGIVEIFEEGLYLIYAQMYYLTSSSLNSYAINLQLGEGKGREDTVVAACSAEAATTKLSELSCFTAVVRYLHRGDRMYITQRERNRKIIFRDNKSFLGLTLLNSPHGQ